MVCPGRSKRNCNFSPFSEEDTQIVPEIFPGLNTTGDHPTIEYFYAFFEPYISGPMPLSGMEPNSVYVVPNTAPQITSNNPVELSLTMETNTSQLFTALLAMQRMMRYISVGNWMVVWLVQLMNFFMSLDQQM